MSEAVEFDDATGRGFIAAMQDTRFPEVSHRLQKGVHMGPEDGALSSFVLENFRVLRDYLSLWGGDLVRSVDGYIHLVPGERYHGSSQLGRHDMAVGMALAQMRTDPALIGRGLNASDVAMRVERACGSEDSYLRVMVNRKRQGTVTGQRDKALELIGKSLRKLGGLGFCDLTEDPVRGDVVRPRAAAMRFAEPARLAGGDEDYLATAIGMAKEEARTRAASAMADEGEASEGDAQ